MKKIGKILACAFMLTSVSALADVTASLSSIGLNGLSQNIASAFDQVKTSDKRISISTGVRSLYVFLGTNHGTVISLPPGDYKLTIQETGKPDVVMTAKVY